MILIDTGYLIGILRPTDELHFRAVAWSYAINDRLLITEYILCEAMNQLSGLSERAIAHQMLKAIRIDKQCQVIYATPKLFNAGVDLHSKRQDKDWSLTD